MSWAAGRVRYRAGQFWRYLRPAPLSAADQAEVRQALPPALFGLFERLAPGEQAHSLTVLRAVVRALPGAPPELRQAALLHDVGKSRAPLTLPGRVLVVAVKTLWPARAAAWGQAAPTGLRRPFVTAAQHPAWGAELAAQAGAPPLTVALIRRHQTPVTARVTLEDTLLAALQAADDDA